MNRIIKQFATILTACVLSVQAHATLEDTDVMVTSLSMVEYCGITNVENIDFVDILPAVDPVTNSTQTFDVEITCPDGNYNLDFPGSSYGWYANGILMFKIASTPGGSHLHAGLPFTVTGGTATLTFYATIHNSAKSSETPKAGYNWSGNLNMTLESVP